MVAERKKQEAKTFVCKKGMGYVLYCASPEEKKYFDGILYNNGTPSITLHNYTSFFSYIS